MAVANGDVHHPGGRQLLDEFGSERCGLRRTAAQTSAAAPSVDLKTEPAFSEAVPRSLLSDRPPRTSSEHGKCALFWVTQEQPNLSGGGQRERRLASCTHFPDEHPLQGLNHFRLVDSISVAMTQFSCKKTCFLIDILGQTQEENKVYIFSRKSH